MNRIPARDGFAEKWTEYESEVLWFEQSLKPSERPQLVARLFKHGLVLERKHYSQKVPRRLLAKTLSNTWNSCSSSMEYFQFLITETNWMMTSSDSND